MNRTIKLILAVLFVLIITFSAISITQNIGSRAKLDVTQQKLYTLTDGTKSIVSKLDQPIKLRLYYAKTATIKAPDSIKYFNSYYEFVKSLLEEYVIAANGNVELELIDPRPFSDDEVEAVHYGLKKFPITEEESFFFGLVVQTQFGADKVVPFFSPNRQNFVEYDISYLIDTAITRQKKKIGILSSLPVMGQDISPYMAQMMQMQGQASQPPWAIVEHLEQQYEVERVPEDTEDINNVDTLLIIHPKFLSPKTIFAIDQFILKGGRTIICVDPHSYADQPTSPQMQMQTTQQQSSELNKLLNTWGLDMPKMTFVGDRSIATKAAMTANQRPEDIIGYLSLQPPNCFNPNSVTTAELNYVRFLFAGALQEIAEPNENSGITRIPLLTTTDKGNTFTIENSFELKMFDPPSLMKKFVEGNKPIAMGYLITGKLPSSFPEGIDIQVPDPDPNNTTLHTNHITGLIEAAEDCAVIVFSDVDFLSDMLAYQNSMFGKVVVGDNSALLLNAIDELSGSADLISIRSRGNFQRPFSLINEIEEKAELETAEEVEKINAEIQLFEEQLQQLLSAKTGQEQQILGSNIVQQTRELEVKKVKARQQLRDVKMKKRETIEKIGNKLRSFNMLMAPAIILIVAILLTMRRSLMKRHYISHASDS